MPPVALTAALAVCAWLAATSARAETIFVSNEQDSSVSLIDGGSLSVVATIPVGRRPRGIGISADGRHLYVAVGDDNRIDVVANENDNLVSVIDIRERRIVTEVPVGVEPVLRHGYETSGCGGHAA